jgi:hypothetical protein
MPNPSRQCGLLAVLIAATFASNAPGQIVLHSTQRMIQSLIQAGNTGGAPPCLFDSNLTDSIQTAGDYNQSFTQTVSCAFVQVQSTVSQNTSLTISPGDVLFGGTLHINATMAAEYDPNLGAGDGDLDYFGSATLSLDILETVNYSLTARASHVIEFNGWASSLEFTGTGVSDVFVGDSNFNGIRTGPNSVTNSGTLAPGGCDLSVNVGEIWPHSGPVSRADDRTVVFSLHVWAQPSHPIIDSAVLSETNLVASGSGGVTNGTYYVLSSTNLALPLLNWTKVATNEFDGAGHFAFTNAVVSVVPQRFFIIRLP